MNSRNVVIEHESMHLFLGSLDSSLGDLATLGISLDDGLDDTDSDSLSHVTDGESTKRWVVSEGFDTHRLGWNHLDDSSITRLDELGGGFSSLTSSSIDLLEELGELAGNVSSVAIQDWSVTGTDLTWVVEDDDLGVEALSTLWWIVLGVTADVSSSNILDGDVLDVETDVVTWNTFDELFVVHFDGLDFSGDSSGSESDNHTGLDDTSLDSADWNRANTGDLVHILERKSEWLVSWSGWGINGIDSLEKSLSASLASLGLLLPALVPWGVGGDVNHVVTVETGDGDERDRLWVVSDLLDEGRSLLDDFVESSLGPLGGVHLVDGDDQLLDTKSVGKKSVLTSLTILGDTGLELTSTSGNDENGAISLGSTSNHVLDEVTMTWGVNDGDEVLGSLELPESDIDGDTTLTFGLQLVQNPGILEGTLSEFSGFL